MNFSQLMNLLLSKVSFLIMKHNKDTEAHGLLESLTGVKKTYECNSMLLISYADVNGMLDTYTLQSGTKAQFYTDIENYYINEYGYTASDPIFEYFILDVIRADYNLNSISDNCYIFYNDDTWDNIFYVYAYDYTNSSFILLSNNKTKTLTINYTNGTSEDIDFYIK